MVPWETMVISSPSIGHRGRTGAPSAPAAPPLARPNEAASEANQGEPPRDGWLHLFSSELLEIGQRLTPEHLQTAVEAAQGVGEGLQGVWSDLKERVSSWLELPQVEQHVDAASRERLVQVVMQAARGLGYTAAGIQGLGGLYKLQDGWRQKSRGRQLDGLFDLTTSAAVASSIAGLGIAPLVLAPLAATTGVIRGGYHALAGSRRGDTRAEVQGALDATRSASLGLRLMGSQVGWLGTLGAIVAPIAGAIQIGRGALDLSSGLTEKAKDKQMQGLSDLGAGVGLLLSMSALGTIPGLALVAASMGGRVLYQVHDGFQGWADRQLEQRQSSLQSVADGVLTVAKPVLQAGRWVAQKVLRRSPPPPASDPGPPSPSGAGPEGC